MSPENEEKTEWVDDELVKVKLLYPFGVSVKVDLDTLNELDLIAMFDRKKRATMIREWLIEKIRVYKRYPAYKSFLANLREMKKHEKKVRKITR